MASITSPPVTSELSFKDVGNDQVDPAFPLKHGGVVCLRSSAAENWPTRFYVDTAGLVKHSRSFKDMIETVQEQEGNESVIQMTESAYTLEVLCKAIGEDTKDFPDLLKTGVGCLVGLYGASLKYAIPSVQILAEHTIRFKFKSDCSEIRTANILAELLQLAMDFDRDVMLRDVANVAAQLAPSLSEGQLSHMLSQVDARCLRILLEEFMIVRKTKQATIETTAAALMDAISDRFGTNNTWGCTNIKVARDRVEEAVRW